jgi:hypothetical protein
LPRTRTTKKLAQRIDLDYFKRPSPLRHWKFVFSIALPALAILWLAWYAVRGDPRVYSAGKLSATHAVFSKQCSACHLTQMGFFSKKVSDQKCLACHDGAVHQAKQTFTPSCASCHADHRGAIRLAATDDANCTQCHANLSTTDSKSVFEGSIKRFQTDHPEFAILRSGRGDPTTIQLNHYRHLQPNLLGPNGSHVQMVCSDCHRSAADANEAWPFGTAQDRSGTSAAIRENSGQRNSIADVSARAYMSPATYIRTCAACHTLQFDKRVSDAVPHDAPDKIHPFIVATLQVYIAAHPADLRVPRDPIRDLPQKAIPADFRLLTPAQWVEERTAQDEQLLWRKTCKQCHALVFGNGGNLPKIAPSNVTIRFMAHANFDHSQHGLVDCKSCHALATTSQASSDVLLPGIATCRSCHKSGAEAAESRCFECHTYHDPAKRKAAHSSFSLADLAANRHSSSATR